MNNEIVYEIDAHNHLVLKSKFNGLEVATIDGGDIEEILHKVKMYNEEYDTLFSQNNLMQQIAKDYEQKEEQLDQLTNNWNELEEWLIYWKDVFITYQNVLDKMKEIKDKEND